jgi:predicted RecA/RadA family phage recombinase
MKNTRALLFYLCSSVFISGSSLWAQCPARTTITDTLYNADGSLASGRVVIAWPTFAIGACQVVAGQASVNVANGAFSVPLYPNDTAVPAGASYRATYYLKSGKVTTEYWVVPTSTLPVALAAVRSSTVPVPTVMFSQAQVTNLVPDLAKKVELPIPCAAGKFLQANGSSAPPQVNCVDGNGGGGGAGTVTSVGLALPAQFSVSGSPVTTSGTLTAGWVNVAANVVLAGPSSGGAAAPAFRSLVAADIPSLDASKITSGSFSDAFVDNNITASNYVPLVGGTMTGTLVARAGATGAGTAPFKFQSGALMTTPENFAFETDDTSLFFTNSSGARKPLAFTDSSITGNAATATLATAATALAANGPNCTGNDFALGVDAVGAAECAQPAFANLSGSLTLAQTPLTTRGDLLTVNATPALARLGIGAGGTFLRSNGADPAWAAVAFSDVSGTVSDAQLASNYSGTGACTNQFVRAVNDNAAPTCAAVSLAADVTSTLPLGNGGTNATTSQGAINNLSQLTTNGDLLYHNGTNSTRLARGASGECLTSTSTTVQWGSCGPGGGTAFREFTIAGFNNGVCTFTNLGASYTECGNQAARNHIDFSGFTDLRVIWLYNVAASTGDFRIHCSDTSNFSSETLMVQVDNPAVNTFTVEAWTTIPSACKTAGGVYVRFGMLNGNGTEDPQVRRIQIQVR